MKPALRRTLLACALAAVMAGCTTTPTAPPAVDLPAPTATEAMHLERWWTDFENPALTALID